MAEELQHEIGVAPPRRLARLSPDAAARLLSAALGREILLPETATVIVSPPGCPACGGGPIQRAFLVANGRKAHPAMWHEIARLADSYVCEECGAGWIERDEHSPMTWVRPCWL
jgi:predicted RNA-binding Zn-ribbon protein involved in translation (DUF1610 family)